MAVARKIKTLLTVNILVFVGIILFSVYCRIQDRSQELVQIVRSADRRARSRGAKVGSLADRESILQRLDHLEEVVYNQLNVFQFSISPFLSKCGWDWKSKDGSVIFVEKSCSVVVAHLQPLYKFRGLEYP
ncbi:hypothetical protein BTVI_22195 [Pitangus sulphuratus]|nr:hypothetical protein BTVI_22195 [Pitangus sulphuratus]